MQLDFLLKCSFPGTYFSYGYLLISVQYNHFFDFKEVRQVTGMKIGWPGGVFN